MNQTLERSWFNQHRSQNQHPKRHPATPSRRPDDPRHDDNQTSTPSKTFKRWSQVLRMRCNIWSKVSGFWTSQSQEFLETKSLASENWNNASKRLKGANQIGKTSHHILSMDPYTKNRSKSNLHLHGTMDKNPTETTVTRVFFFGCFFHQLSKACNVDFSSHFSLSAATLTVMFSHPKKHHGARYSSNLAPENSWFPGPKFQTRSKAAYQKTYCLFKDL